MEEVSLEYTFVVEDIPADLGGKLFEVISDWVQEHGGTLGGGWFPVDKDGNPIALAKVLKGG